MISISPFILTALLAPLKIIRFLNVSIFMMSRKGAQSSEDANFAELAIAASLGNVMDEDEPEFDVDEVAVERYALNWVDFPHFLLN